MLEELRMDKRKGKCTAGICKMEGYLFAYEWSGCLKWKTRRMGSCQCIKYESACSGKVHLPSFLSR